MTARQEQTGLAARLPQVLAEEVDAGRAALRDLVARPVFRRALGHSSRTLSLEVDKWLADERQRPRRQSLVRLAKYVARAAAKTSPFSTFTSSGTALWNSGGGAAVRFLDRRPVRTVVELNGAWLSGLLDALAAAPHRAARMRLRVNPSVMIDGDTLRFLGRPPDEPIISLPATAAIRRCLEVLAGGTELPAGEVRDRLAGGAERVEQVGHFLDRLVGLGLLHRVAPVPDLSTDPLGALAGWLAADGSLDGDEAAAAVRAARSLLRHPEPVDDWTAHVEHGRATDAAVGRLLARAGLAADLPYPPLHESAATAGTVAELSLPRWGPALDDLDTLRRALGVVDRSLPYRIALAEFCAERFGGGATVPLLTVHEAIARELVRPDGPPGPAGRDLAAFGSVLPGRAALLAESHLHRLRELGRLREELFTLLGGPAAVGGVVAIDARALRELTAGWPPWIDVPQSVAFYLQAAHDASLLVVNCAHNGHGRGRSRALHLVRQVGGALPEQGWAVGATPVAELSGLFGYTLNLRLPTAPYEIDYPFTNSARPAGQRIPISELRVVHDAATGRVHLTAGGVATALTVQHLGMMTDILLPPVARMLARAFGSGYYIQPGRPLPPPQQQPVTAGVVRTPRVQLGRVVLRRACWAAPAGEVPRHDKGESDAGYLLRMVRWRHRHGIPQRCYVRVFSYEVGASGERPVPQMVLDKSRKPVYVDFASWYLSQAFERMLPDARLVVFEEALPAPEDGLGAENAEHAVTELIVELGTADAHA
jgi:hypothetical protein